eukprot:CAMPEP_0206288528 /NCGR_PEP_ID=MMETSP0106_2-20121207/1661_1 /ASSEMBLY_ACC=CAM_ASM_000206 /TAXON_ID=81532 /ORGANISM="Acanthoeca-like sp., Strain 10tr" /LENGTH=161 /DNA_ID=CAMNT_0053719081 /DNA_START=145 /DNA_END=632 /DNA_ORIENTATION=-
MARSGSSLENRFAVAVPGGLSDLGPGEACGPSMIGHLGGCADGLACECVGDCADPFIGDAPSTCVPEDGFEGRRLGEACGPSMIGNLGKCAAGYSCECVGFCADPFVADAPHIVSYQQPGREHLHAPTDADGVHDCSIRLVPDGHLLRMASFSSDLLSPES